METSRKVIYRSKRSWNTKKNFQIFEVTPAAVEHIPPTGQQCQAAKAACETAKRNRMDGVEDEVKP